MSDFLVPVVNDPHTNGHRHETNQVPTNDSKVRVELRKLGEPITLFGEDDADRRQRLLRLLGEQKHTNFAFAEVEQSDELMDDESEEDDEEFYTPGLEQLLAARKDILASSVTNAQQRLKLQRRLATEYDQLRVLKHRRHINKKLSEYGLNGSYTLQGNTRTLSAVRVNKNNTKIACGSWDGSLYVMEKSSPDNFAQVTRLAPGSHTEKVTLTWSPTNDNIVVSGGAEGTLNVWKCEDDATMKPQQSVKNAHAGRIAKTEVHPSGNYIATTSFDQTWKLWDIKRLDSEILEQEGHDKEVYAAAFHPDGSLLATGGLDAIGRVWDLRSGRSVAVLESHIKGIYSMDWSPNGYHLASASGDCSIKIWDMRKLDAELFSIPAHTKLVSEVKFVQVSETSPLAIPHTDENANDPQTLKVDGTFLASSSYDRTVKLWSADNWVAVKTLQGHTDKVMSCDVSNDGLYVVSCGWDRAVRMWSTM